MKAVSIIGLVIAGLAIIAMGAWNNDYEYESAIGWGFISAFYLIAVSIVALKNSKK